MDPNIEVIVLSDDEDAVGDHTGAIDNSVLIVEEQEKRNELPEAGEILDEDMTITFSQKASILPHARYDCTAAFSFTESSVSDPEGDNAAFCEQCFCYICDQPASECKIWTVPGFCHCNAHKRSVHWKSLRDKRIVGYLHELKFTFNPADMDSDLRRAETSLLEFAQSLAQEYTAFLMAAGIPDRLGTCACRCHFSSPAESSSASGGVLGCYKCYSQHRKHVLSTYSPVKERILAFLNEAMKETFKTYSVMALGAVKLFITHSVPGTMHALEISHITMDLFGRVLGMLQVLLVDADFPASFVTKLQDLFLILPLPPDLRKFRNGLNVLPWDDPLLSGVLKGQNTSGVRQVKGRRLETLHEAAVVVTTRVIKLQRENRYRELARYLKVVKSDNAAMLQVMRDWIPLYLCKVGDYSAATQSLLTPMHGAPCPASRLSPAQFCVYLRIFMSGHAPLGMPYPPQVEFGPYFQKIHGAQPDPLLNSAWAPIQGRGNLLRRQEVLKFVLRVLNCNNTVFLHYESWVKTLHFANLSSSPGPDGSSLPEPDYSFLLRTRDMAAGILSELTRTSQIQIPRNFQGGYPEQALLLLATQALAMRLQHSKLQSIVTVILTFKLNPWVMPWLICSLQPQPRVLQDLFCAVLEELAHGQCKSPLRVQDTAEQFFMASFLCMLFLEPSVRLHPGVYPVSGLLLKWNEFENPWQYHLRRLLEVNESSLGEDKKQILIQMIAWSVSH